MTTIKKEKITINEFLEVVKKLDRKVIEIFKVVVDEEWDELIDSRPLLLKNLHELHFSTMISFCLLAEEYDTLYKQDWWFEKFDHLIKMIKAEESFENFVRNRENQLFSYIKDNYVLNFYYEFESKIRNLTREIKRVRNLNKNTQKNKTFLLGNESFYDIVNGFFIDFLKFEDKDIEVLKLYSSIRNTIHNSGFFYSTTRENQRVDFKDRYYEFINESPVDFIDFNFLHELIYELLILIEKTLNNEKIKAIKEIIDPISRVDFKEIDK